MSGAGLPAWRAVRSWAAGAAAAALVAAGAVVERAYQALVADKTALPAGIWSLAGPRRLVLVTCGGPIEHTPAGSTYADNVLICVTPATAGPAKTRTGGRHHLPHRPSTSSPRAGRRPEGAPQLVT